MGAGGETDAGVEVLDERGSFARGGFDPLLDPCRCFSTINIVHRRDPYLQEALHLSQGHTTIELGTWNRHCTGD